MVFSFSLRAKLLVSFLGLNLLLLTSCTDDKNKSKPIDLQVPKSASVPIDSLKLQSDSTKVDTLEVTHTIEMKTSAGIILFGLYGKDAPKTVTNFTELAKKKYYEGILFHRVVPNFVIQGGDPLTKKTEMMQSWGTGGDTYNNQPLIDEIDTVNHAMNVGYSKGVLAMANAGRPSTGRSQFFICLDGAAELPPQYTIFGRVLRGIEVVSAIEKGKPNPDDPRGEIPLEPVKILSMTVNQAGRRSTESETSSGKPGMRVPITSTKDVLLLPR